MGRGKNHPDIAEHHRKMDSIVKTSNHSPPSLYSGSYQLEVETDLLTNMTHGIHRSNKAQALRQLALKQKIEI